MSRIAVMAFAAAAAAALAAPRAHAEGAAPTGTVEGQLSPAPKRGVVWLESVPAGAWTAPKDIPTMSQRGARFAPDFLVVTVGQSVTMPNDDRLVHNVFSISPAKKFDLGHYAQGESRTIQFEKPGVIELFCNIHENMHATIVVAPSTFWAQSDADGRFVLRGVPPGAYKLAAYSPDGGTGGASAKVTGGGTARASIALEKK
jgi:plastocyanin